ncbi:hypothetical protein [Psychrobacter sp. I-STPA10]|uniref:hypothetical protein n=1 Tax=Psychrobacter sp. I-STPA10 TaxID=2585769 RepID=UPI001E57BC1F|nr:hypothetical protein [Psychrobacter sp. I-STPA10]
MQVTLEFDEDFYQDLVKEVGENNISEYIQSVLRPQLAPKATATKTMQTSKIASKNNELDAIFGKFARRDKKTVSVEQMNDAIAHHLRENWS